jgi:hypothetical protein
MRRFPLLLALLFSIITAVPAYAQKGYTISGIVKDNVNETLIGASVSLRNSADSLVAGTSVDLDGHFALSDVMPGPYRLSVSYLGYDDYSKNINVVDGEVNLGIIRMAATKSTTLNEVKIVERTPPVTQKEDTTQYNASSYKVNPDASAEDLVRKLPGMDLSSGTPQAQGEQVAKVLVDGKPFFGSDASTSLKNLPAEVIDKIQVYDEKSEQSQFTGFDDGNTSKTINIITKPGKRQGVFGKVYAGMGADSAQLNDGDGGYKYNVGGNINFFQGNRRISLIGQSNNINIQNFSSQDLLGISGGSGGRGFGGGGGGRGGGGGGSFFGGGGGGGNFTMTPQNGISKTNAVGLNYSDKWGKKIDVTASYFFNNSENVTSQLIQRNYVLDQQAGQTYNESNIANTKNYNHRFNMRFNYNIDSSNSILFIPTISTQSNNSTSNMFGQTLQSGTDVLNQTSNTYSSDLSGYNLNGMLLYRHKFKKKGRTLSLFANGGYNKNDGNSQLYAPVTGADTSYTLDQKSSFVKSGWNVNSNVNYTEPLSRKSFLQVQYGLNYQQSESDKKTYNYSSASSDYTNLDSLLSNTFTTNYLTNKGGITYRFMDSSYNFNIGVDFQNANLDNERVLPFNNALQRSFNNILPNARFQYNFDKRKTLRLFYRTSTNAPSVDQLQDVVNNSNPLQQSSGNPNLVQSYQHNLAVRYNATNANSGSTFFALLSGTATQDYIGNNTTIATSDMTINNIPLKKGGQFSRPDNMDGYYNLRSFVTYGVPVTGLKSNFNVNASAGYVRTPGIINDQKNFANSTSLGLGLVLSSNISEKLDFTVSSNSNYNIVRNTLTPSANSEFFYQTSKLLLNYIFWKGIVFNTDITHQFYTGLSEGYNQSYLLWNMSIAKKLFRKQQGEIRLSVYDLLKQNASIVPTVNDAYIQYAQTNVLRQYFMLTFTYNLRFFKGGASMKDVEEGNRGGRERGDFHGPGPGMMDGGMPPGMPMPPGGGR